MDAISRVFARLYDLLDYHICEKNPQNVDKKYSILPVYIKKFLWRCEDVVEYNSGPGPLFTKKTPSYGYRDPHYKPKTVWRPSQVYNGNPHTDKTVSS